MKKTLHLIAMITLFSSAAFSMNNSELPFDPDERSIRCSNLLAKIPPYTALKEEDNIKSLRFAYRSIKQYMDFVPEGAKELANHALGWVNSITSLNDDDKAPFISDWQQIAAQLSNSNPDSN